jgi:beta-galactosidase beta subunit
MERLKADLGLTVFNSATHTLHELFAGIPLATAREVAQTRLNEIQQGFVEIDMDLLFGREH